MTLEIDACAVTDRGCRRKDNQDSVCYVSPRSAGVPNAGAALAVVADGMGGHRGGQVASGIAIDAIRSEFLQADTDDLAQVLARAFETANEVIFRTAAQVPSLHGMGTTATALLLQSDKAVLAHIGDSRAYLCGRRTIEQLTEDDTLVRALVRDGMMSEQTARHHPDRNLLVKALGTKAMLEASIFRYPDRVCAGDTFVLCSDGLHDLVSDEEIAAHTSAPTAEQACRDLLGLALDRGASDNVSVIVLKIHATS